MSNTAKRHVDSDRESVIWRQKPSDTSGELLCVELAGVTLPDKNYAISRNRRSKKVFDNLYVIEYVVSGAGYISSEGREARVEAGDLYVIHRRTVHEYHADKQQPFCKKWINVSGSFINAMEQVFLSEGPFTVMRLGEAAERVIDAIHGILQTEKDAGQRQELIMKRLLELFLLMDEQRRKSSETMSLYERICGYVDENICEPLSLSSIAEEFFISASTLYRVFIKNAGVSPKEYVAGRKIAAAKRMIGANSETFNTIAAHLGYYDSHHFFHAFKNATGMSPSEYREQALSSEGYEEEDTKIR